VEAEDLSGSRRERIAKKQAIISTVTRSQGGEDPYQVSLFGTGKSWMTL
jgi:hypothetical protein